MSLTAGIDLAADRANTAVAVIDWSEHPPSVIALLERVRDDEIAAWGREVTKIGIDCPLGWPAAFVDFVTAHAAMRPVGVRAEHVDQRRRLAYRATDLWVARQAPPLRPLSVSADRIAHVAFRAAALLPSLDETLDRSGLGRVVEVYPAGSLHRWGLPFRGYKGRAGEPLREEIVAALRGVLAFRHGGHAILCAQSDHALDAVVSAMSARAAEIGAATLPGLDDLSHAVVEGWIHLPTCDLDVLARV